jgi:hypothetical protein
LSVHPEAVAAGGAARPVPFDAAVEVEVLADTLIPSSNRQTLELRKP